jgi:hypothetical protein
MASAIKVRGAVACDDIRTEENGKLIAIGVTNPIIGVTPEGKNPPRGGKGSLPVHFLILLDVEKTGVHEVAFRTRTLDGRKGSGMQVTVEFTAAVKNVPFPIGPLRVPIASGERGFALQQRVGERWRSVATWAYDTPVPEFDSEEVIDHD